MLKKLHKIFMVPKNFSKNFIMNRPPSDFENFSLECLLMRRLPSNKNDCHLFRRLHESIECEEDSKDTR